MKPPVRYDQIEKTELVIENKSISELIPYIANSRTHDENQVSQIAASIKEFGFTNPVLLDGDNGIIAGHGRIMGAKKLGMSEVPCIRLRHLTDAQKRAYVIADNKLSLNAGWDMELLASEIQGLIDDEFDVDLMGFSQDELDELLADDDVEGLTDEDAVPELTEEPVSREGDIWVLGNHRLMCGDSTDAGTVALLMNGQKADMVFTDPPYGVDYEGINNDDRAGLENLLDKSFSNYIEFSKSGAAVYIFHSDRCADIFHKVFREYFHFSSMIIWSKNSLTLSQTDYQSKHEPCMYGWNKNGSHTFFGDRKQTSVWNCDKETVKGHTTPKPIEVIEKGLLNSSKSDDLIIDLFGGSGSTLIAAEKNNRNCYMMELDPRYTDVIIKRWEEFTGKCAILDGTDKTYEVINVERG